MNAQSETWGEKLGLGTLQETDELLVNDLLELLGATEVDMTMFFRLLCSMTDPDVAHTADAFYEGSEPDTEAWNQWLNRWWIRVDGEPDRGGDAPSQPEVCASQLDGAARHRCGGRR